MHMIRAIAAAAVLALATPAAAAADVQRVVSGQGIEAWLVADHTNPIISVDFLFRGGAIADPEGKAGTAHMVSGLLDEGAGDLPSFEFQRMLEDKAIRISFNAGRDTFSGSLRTLSEERELAFDMLRLALTEPRFDDEPVERVRSQIQASLARALQDPDTIAARMWMATLFPDHPYGRAVSGYPETIAAIRTEDLRAFVRDRLARDNLIVGVSGDVTPEQLGPLLDKAFGALPEKAAPLGVGAVQPAVSGETLVERRDVPQSVVIFGDQGLARRDPDWYAAFVMNYILGGGGFASRLMEEVREKRGLAYGVSTYLQPMEHAQLIAGSVATANARVAESLQVIRDEWQRMREHGPSAEELANGKTYLTGSFPLQLTSTGAIAGILTSMQLHGLGIDYLDRRNALIEAVTPADVRRVAQRILDPARLTAVVVGDPAGLQAAASPPPAARPPGAAEAAPAKNAAPAGR